MRLAHSVEPGQGVKEADAADQDVQVDPTQLADFLARARGRMDQAADRAASSDTVESLLARLRG